MNNYQEIEGDLITLAKEGMFDVIAHGCNCFCTMKRGIAPQMAEAFDVQNEKIFTLEAYNKKGDINKLGQIEIGYFNLKDESLCNRLLEHEKKDIIAIINAYTQYNWSTETKPFDYEAFWLCMRKINHIFKGKHIGLPQIGSHLAGGDWEIIEQIIKKELKDMKITIVKYKP